MKKQLYFFIFSALLSMAAFGQSWVIYEADVLPDAAEPAWGASNTTDGGGWSWTVVDDPLVDGNKLLNLESMVAGESANFKTSDFDPVPTQFTAVMRVKQNDAAAERLIEYDMHINGLRDQLIVRANNQLTLQRSGGAVDLDGTFDATKWNVIRVTMDASSGTEGIVKVYLNEDPTPVLESTTTTTTTSNYFRFGDGNSSPTYSSYVDFITYDVSGAYDPTAHALPAGLIPDTPVGNWTIYTADVLPDAADPAWGASNTTDGGGWSWAIESDPDVAANNLLSFNSMVSGESANFKTSNFDPVPTQFTAVMRVKQQDAAAERLIEYDMHINGLRDQLIVRANNQLTLQRSGGAVDLDGTFDATKWNVIRVTIDASSGTEGIVKVYLNEDATPVLVDTTTTTTTSNYFRFGDGNSSPTYSSYVDFITYDVSGAYAPDETVLPEGLVPDGTTPVGDWTIYTADVLPDVADPAWGASNTTDGGGWSWTVVDDPLVDGNKLLNLESMVAGESANFKTSNFDPVPTQFTAVMRVKQNDAAADRLIEYDMHINGLRDQLIVRANNQLTLQRSGGAVDLDGTFDATKWNVIRVTMDASSGTEGIVKVYLNEDPTPVLESTTTTTTTSNYFRFGDGNSTPTYSSFIDFITYDVSGAYAPDETVLPEGLVPEVTVPIGDWTIYTADVLPDAADPAWGASNSTDGGSWSWSVVDDPIIEGNKLLNLESMVSGESANFKTSNFDPVPTKFTAVMRVKQNDLDADRLIEFDMHINGLRDQLIVRANNQLTLQRSGGAVDLDGTFDATRWNVIRVSMDASSGTEGIVKVYLNEDPTPVLESTTTTTTTSNYFRFGDGNSSPTYSSFIDFITYDVSGAYAPDQTALPPGLIPATPIGDWTIYAADVLPENADPAWGASNTTDGGGWSWTVTDDPDVEGNKLLNLESMVVGESANYKTDNFEPVPTQFTAVMRVKQNDLSAERLIEYDMHINGLRDQLVVRANNQLTLQRSGGAVDLDGTLDVTQWNVIRATLDASSGTEGIVKIYLNEDPSPVLVDTTTTTTTSNYFRFGDGNSSPTYSSLIDFISYDVTGAFAPDERALPPGLIPGTEIDDEEDAAHLSDLQVNGETVAGFFSSVFTYDVELPYGTTELPVVTATALKAGASVKITDATELPGSATVLVTGAGGSTQTYTVNFTVALNDDATLSGVVVNGNPVADFDPETTSYRVPIEFGTEEIPEVTATTTDPEASYVVTDPEEVLGTAIIEVTAANGVSTQTYELTYFYEISSDATLADLQVGGSTIAGFDPEVYIYSMEVATFDPPGIFATPNHERAIAFVTYPDDLPGSATVLVTAEDGTELTYTIDFTTTAVVLSNKVTKGLKLYPNPVVDRLILDNVSLVRNIQLFNTSGQLLKAYRLTEGQQNMEISFTDLQQGIYMINVEMNDGSVEKVKIIK